MIEPSERRHDHAKETLSAQTIHDLRTPLTLVRAHAQMVARWLRRNQIANADGVLQRLTVIDTLIVQLGQALDGLHEHAPDQDDDGPSS